jgi:biopolymer transport protein ExbB
MNRILLLCISAAALAAAEPATVAATATARAATQHSWVVALVRWEMWPLWALSIVLVAMVIERWKTLQRGRILDDRMMTEVAELCGAGKVAETEAQTRANDTVLGRAWAQGLHEFQLDGADLKDALSASSLLAFKPLKRNLQAISAIGVVGPLCGLLGTVLGMIITFGNLSATGGAEKAALAGGIAVALYATAGGLIVAIPALLFGRFFQGRLIGFSEEAEMAIDRVSYRFANHRHSAKAASATGQG